MVLKSIGAYAIREDDPDNPLLADSVETLNKAIALHWIGRWQPPDGTDVGELRTALLSEDWAEAVLLWMRLADERLNIYPHGIEIHESRDYPDEEYGPHIQTMPLFQD